MSGVKVERSENFKKRPGQGTKWGDVYPIGMIRECERVNTRNEKAREGG